MRSPASSRLLIACALVAGAASPQCAYAQSVQQVIVNKSIDYVQTSAIDVKVNPQPQGPLYGGAYGFGVNVDGSNMASLPAPTVAGPFNVASLGTFFNNGVLVYNPHDQGWRLGAPNANNWGSPTLADLQFRFGNGTYTVTVAGNAVPLNLVGDAFPNAPVVTLSGGAWVNGKYTIDADRALTITTNAFAGYGSHADDHIEIDVDDATAAAKFASATPGNTLSYTIPASSLAPGNHAIDASFAAVTDKRSIAAFPGSIAAAVYSADTVVQVLVSAPVFPMAVTSNVTPTVANVTAAIQYRPQDVGTTGNVYVFALAPASMVSGAAPAEPTSLAKDVAPLNCVLAQLNASGQLTAVSAASLQAYLSGVLSAQGASINVLNNVSTAILQGSVFYVGYGSSSSAMLNGGTNRSAVAIPGSSGSCQPQAPQSGWWWNQNESGRGFSIETRGNHLFMAGYLYDTTGRATWVVSSGTTSLDGSFYFGDLLAYSGGQTLTGAYRPPAAPAKVGTITLAFTGSTAGTLVWPGGSIPIERFAIAAPTSAAKYDFVPENGWWWSASEGGRGYFMEFANNSAFVAGYMYDASGNPVWYAAGSAAMPSATTFQSPWAQYANGQTMTGTYKAPTVANANVGSLAIQFQSASSATLTLPDGRQVPVVRFGF